MTDPTPVDPKRCPLCGTPNACALAARQPGERGVPDCWCAEIPIPRAILDQVPEPARGHACICRACAEERQSA